MGNNVRISMESAIEEQVRYAVTACAKRYAFDASEAMRFALEQQNNRSSLWETFTLEVLGTSKNKPSSSNIIKKNKKQANPKSKVFPLPYNGSISVDEYACNGIRNNNGLMTQCTTCKIADGQFCKDCAKQADKNENDMPDYGTIQLRSSVAIMDYVAPNGKSPISYLKYMHKNNFTMEQVKEEAMKIGVTLSDIHFAEPDKSIKKGRPRKEKKVVALQQSTDDLFATLVQEANAECSKLSEKDDDEMSSLSNDDNSTTSKSSNRSKLTDEQKLENQQKKDIEKAEKLKAKEIEAAEKLKAKEIEAAEKLKAKEIEAAEKLKAKEIAAAEKLKAKEIAAAEKLKAKEIAAAELKAKKELENADKPKAKPRAKAKEKDVVGPELVVDTEDEEEADNVKKVVIGDKSYLKSIKTGEIYDLSQNLIGIWNETTNEIDEYADEDEEEEEETYEE